MKKISDKQRALNKEYSELRKEYLKENMCCKGRFTGCTGCRSDYLTIHHMKGRGKFLLDISTWVTLCFNCHKFVEEHPNIARALGLTFSRMNDGID